MTSYIGPPRSSPSTTTVISAFRQRAKTASVLHAYESLPPSALPVSFTRLATAPLMPALAMLANQVTPSRPAHVCSVARPRSTSLLCPERARSSAPSSVRGMSKVRMKSPPVPRWTTASSTPSRPATPFTISLTVPSPPTATRRRAPLPAASFARSTRCPGRSERNVSPMSPRSAASCAISGQRLPVAPLSDAGFTRKTVWLMVFLSGDGGERDARHAVDRGLEILVRYALELAADDDVADRQEAARLHLAQGPDREQDRGFHLDSQHAALGPAAVAALVWVVERVRAGDRADAHRLAQLLRRVDGAVDELPVGGRDMVVAANVMTRSAVGGNRGQRHDQVAQLEVRPQPAAGADAQEPLDAELDELLHHDRRGRAAHAGRLHGDRPSLVLARVTEEPALLVPLHSALEVGLGDVAGAQRVTGQQTRLCVFAFLGTDVNGHGGTLLR